MPFATVSTPFFRRKKDEKAAASGKIEGKKEQQCS
jgi:hypothetical protein